MSTAAAVQSSKWMEATCKCGKKFSIRIRDYEKRKRDSGGKEPSCSTACGWKDRAPRKVQVSCDCGCGERVELHEGTLKAKRTRGEYVVFSRACDRRLKKNSPRNQKEKASKEVHHLCAFPGGCSQTGLYQNGDGTTWTCEDHTYWLSRIMRQQAAELAEKTASRIEVMEGDRWELDDGILVPISHGRMLEAWDWVDD